MTEHEVKRCGDCPFNPDFGMGCMHPHGSDVAWTLTDGFPDDCPLLLGPIVIRRADKGKGEQPWARTTTS